MNKPELGKYLGGGQEKDVYEDASREGRVVGKMRRNRESKTQMHGRYYLSRIMHLLLPESIPDTYPTPAKTKTLSMEKIEIDSEMREIQNKLKEYRKYDFHEKAPAHLTKAADEFRKRVSDDPAILKIANTFKQCGVMLDVHDLSNFVFDTNGVLKYWDNDFQITDHNLKSVTLRFNPEGLRSAIDQLPEERRNQALKYFSKLMGLVERDEREFKESLEKNETA